MNALDRVSTKVAVGLAMLAGFVDALGFLELKGIFVSFMTGNSTRLAVSAVTGGIHGSIAVLGAVLGTFVTGMFLATLFVNDRERRRTAIVILGLVTLLLLAGFVLALLSLKGAAIAVMVLAMGAANAAIQRDGEIVVGVTYMTGALVKFAQKLAQADQHSHGRPTYCSGWALSPEELPAP